MHRTSRVQVASAQPPAAAFPHTPQRVVVTLVALLLVALVLSPRSASAAHATGGIRESADAGALVAATYRRHHHAPRYSPSHRSRYSQPFSHHNRYAPSYRHGYRRYNPPTYPGRDRGYRSSHYNGSCRQVTKYSYWHGRRALIGGRECTTARGYSYVVPNSRYLIRYR